MKFSLVALLLPAVAVNGFTIQQPTVINSSPLTTSTSLQSMKGTYDEISAKVTQQLGLQATDFSQTFQAQTWSDPNTGVSGTAEWMSEISPKFLTGASLCSRVGGNSGEEFTVNIWMGPSYDVPNMLLTFGQRPDGTYAVTADYVIRGATPIGSDPQMMEAYYVPTTIDAWNRAFSSPGACPLGPPLSFDTRLLDSPGKISVCNIGLADADAVVKGHVDTFLGWLEGAQQVPARSRGSFNLRDDKLRQFFYKGQLSKSIAEFGPELGPVVAAVNTGPTAEAYVGGGS